MDCKWNTTKSIILQAEKGTEHLFIAKKFAGVSDNIFFLDQIEDIYGIISPKYEYSHRETVSKET